MSEMSLPEHWKTERLEELCRCFGAGMVSKSVLGNTEGKFLLQSFRT